SQASVCAPTSASISCGPSAQSCPSKSSAVVLFAEEGRRHADDAIMLLPAAGLLVACASSMRATGAGPATACGLSRTRMDTPPPRQLRAFLWCCTPPGQKQWLQGGGLLRLTHHTQKKHVLATQLRAQRQTFRQSEAGGVPPQRRKPPQARRPPASPPVVCFPSVRDAPTLCSLLQENTSSEKKGTAASPTSRELCATGVVPPARRIGDGVSVTARTLHTPRATPSALTAAAPWDAPLTNKSQENTRMHPRRLPTAR
ncbi:ribonuclease HI, partial [Trypanosoma cruzi]